MRWLLTESRLPPHGIGQCRAARRAALAHALEASRRSRLHENAAAAIGSLWDAAKIGAALFIRRAVATIRDANPSVGRLAVAWWNTAAETFVRRLDAEVVAALDCEAALEAIDVTIALEPAAVAMRVARLEGGFAPGRRETVAVIPTRERAALGSEATQEACRLGLAFGAMLETSPVPRGGIAHSAQP